MGTNNGELFSELVERCTPFIKATAFNFERKVRSIPENYITVKGSAIVYDREDFENTLLMKLYVLMNKALDTFEDTSAENISRVFCTSGIAQKELQKLVAPHEQEKLTAFSFDDAENGRELPDGNHDIPDIDFMLTMDVVTKDCPDSRVIYDLAVNQPFDFISWCKKYSKTQKRNRMAYGDIPQSYMRQFLIENRGWTKHRFETALRVLRTKVKEVISV